MTGRVRGASWRAAILAIAAIGLVTLGGTALAGHVESGVKSYTGCLVPKDGVIIKVKEGNSPAGPCTAGMTQVHLSGGDITKISVSGGLTLPNGGDGGHVTIALDPKYSLPQTCTNGQVAKWQSSTTSWVCAADNDTTYTAGTGLDLSAGEFNLEESYRLPQGCASGEAAIRNTAAGGGAATWACEQFATADQACSSGQFARGVNALGVLSCAAPPSSGAISGNIGQVGNVPLAGATDVITSSLSSGSYLLFASVEIFNVDSTSDSSAYCYMPGWFTGKAYTLPPGGQESISMASLLENHPGGDVTLECSEVNANVDVSRASLTALKVG